MKEGKRVREVGGKEREEKKKGKKDCQKAGDKERKN